VFDYRFFDTITRGLIRKHSYDQDILLLTISLREAVNTTTTTTTTSAQTPREKLHIGQQFISASILKKQKNSKSIRSKCSHETRTAS
jgi:hypothetical protein